MIQVNPDTGKFNRLATPSCRGELQVGMPESNSMAPKSLADPDEASTPEDVATLYSWANMHGAKYRDFSASRAQAREEARLRVEEAAAAERRRQEEEAERKAQEEAQIAARLAAEAAEAARQAEADRLAEIARQAEAERQAVLAAQEAQRQAVQQRGWQSPPEEAYLGGYAAPFAGNPLSPALLELPALHEVPMRLGQSMGQSMVQPPIERAADFGIEVSTPYGVEFGTGAGQGMNLPSNPNRQPDPYRSSYPGPDVQGSRTVADQNWQRPRGEYPNRSGRSQPVSAQPGSGQHSSPPYPASAQTTINPYLEDDAAPFAALPSYVAPHESYMQSPWQLREEREIREPRELTSRPAWLAQELPAPAVPVNPPAPQPVMSPYGGPPASPPPVQKYVPMYAQSWSQPMMQDSGQNSGQNQNQNQDQSSGQGQGPVDGTLVGSRDRLTNRWFALKSVFDSQAAPAEQVPAQPPARVPVLAVFSLAGGVGKTSLVASLGRALSSRGERVLLVDTAAYGLLPFFFGARDQRPGLLRTFNPPGIGAEAPIQLVSLDPEGQPQESQGQDSTQGSSPERGQDCLAQEVARLSGASHRILVDLPTASGATTRRALRMAPVVLVPIAPDMSSVVSVGAIESFFRHNGNVGGKQIMPYYVLNQFDYSLPLHLDVREVLREQIGDRLLPFALRRSPAVSEALAEGMTVIDYAPGAVVAEDYAHLAQWVRSLSAPAAQSSQSYGSVRWSER
jgi:cellulose synthase operon protein YhjQ